MCICPFQDMARYQQNHKFFPYQQHSVLPLKVNMLPSASAFNSFISITGTEWFRPLGKLAERAVYFANVFSSLKKFFFNRQLSTGCFSESNWSSLPKSQYWQTGVRACSLHLAFCYPSRNVGYWWDDYPNICLAVIQGTLLWQPVKFGICSQTSPGTTFTVCFSIRQ